MKKIIFTELEEQHFCNSRLKLNTEYFYNDVKKIYGYDILDTNFEYVFGFGESVKLKFENMFKEIPMTKSDNFKLLVASLFKKI